MSSFVTKPTCWGDENEYDTSRSKCAYTCTHRQSCADKIIQRQADGVRDMGAPAFGEAPASLLSGRTWDILRTQAVAQAQPAVPQVPVAQPYVPPPVAQVNLAPVFRPPTTEAPPAVLAVSAPAPTPTPTPVPTTTFLSQVQTGSLAASLTTAGNLTYEKNQASPGRELLVRAALAGTVGVLEEVARFARNDGYRLLQRPKTVVKCLTCGTINAEKDLSCQGCKRVFR